MFADVWQLQMCLVLSGGGSCNIFISYQMDISRIIHESCLLELCDLKRHLNLWT